MVMSQEKYEEISKRYGTLLLTDKDVEDVFSFVIDILNAEEDAIKEKVPYATHTIENFAKAAVVVADCFMDVELGVFDEV